MVSFVQGLLAAGAGVARAGSEAIDKEREETKEMSKLTLKKTLENIATAKESHLEDMQTFREQQNGIRALKRFQYKDPETGQLRNVTTAQAIAAIDSTGGDVDKAFELLKDAEIAFKGEGTVAPIQYQTSGAFDITADDLKTEEEDGKRKAPFSLREGREERALEETKTMLDKMGIPAEGYKTPVGLPEVSGVQIVSTKTEEGNEITAVKTGEVYRINAQGEEEVAAAVIGKDQILYVLDASKGKLVPAGNDEWAGFRNAPTTQMTQSDPTVRGIQQEYEEEYFESDGFQKQSEAYRNKRAAVSEMAIAYNKMAPIALDNSVYSVAATTAGGIVERVKIEVEGISAITMGDDNERNVSEDVAELNKFIEGNKGATDIAIKARVLDAMITRAAYKFLQANGDTRPSDADLRRAMLQFSANSAQEFYEKAQNNWSTLTEEATGMREDLLGSRAFRAVDVLDYTESEREAIKSVTALYAPEEMAVEQPYFLDRPLEEVVKDEPDVTEEEQENTFDITVNGRTVKATYDPDQDEVIVRIGGQELSMSSTDAISKGYLTAEQIRGN